MIAVFFDSNVLFTKEQNDYSCVWLLKQLDYYVDKIESAELFDHLKIVVPSIVFEELKRHQLESLKNTISDLRKIELPFWVSDNVPDYGDCKKWLEKEHCKFANSGKRGMVPCEIMEAPDSCFRSVVQRALDKKAPFVGAEKESDKGFKDALIWETILSYKHEHGHESVMWITKDKRLKHPFLMEEYRDLFGEEITVCGNMQEFEEELNRIMKTTIVDAKLLPKNDNGGYWNQLLRDIIFENMTIISLAGGLDMGSDVRYKLDFPTAFETDGGLPAVQVKLWSIGANDEMSSCAISLEFKKEESAIICDCSVDGIPIEIEYDFEGLDEWGLNV